MEITNFDKDVLELSQEVPVVVDFWAPWCGPCQFLGPVMEELASEAEGTWKLAKVNVDQHQPLSVKYNVRSIPSVKMFHQGKIIAEFVGALSKPQVTQWLEDHLPDPRKEILEDIKKSLHNGADAQTLKTLEEFVQAHPDLQEGRLWLASEKVYEQTNEAIELVTDIKIGNPLFDLAEDVRNLGHFMTCELGGNTKLDEKMQAARQALMEKDKDTALQNLIEAVMVDKTYCDDSPRKASIALFHFLGTQHELTKKYRRRFDMALY